MRDMATLGGSGKARALALPPCFVKARADSAGGVTGEPPAPTREERLAAKLRENLRRRKAQTRELAGGAPHALSKDAPSS